MPTIKEQDGLCILAVSGADPGFMERGFQLYNGVCVCVCVCVGGGGGSLSKFHLICEVNYSSPLLYTAINMPRPKYRL